jgi:mono/diheme cytochrome c family protein
MRMFNSMIMAALLAGCASTGAAPGHPGFSPAADRGLAIVQQRCSGCHMVGLDETAATEGPRFRDLQMRYNAVSLARKFAEISRHGTGEMPPVGLAASEAEDIAAYFETLDRRY